MLLGLIFIQHKNFEISVNCQNENDFLFVCLFVCLNYFVLFCFIGLVLSLTEFCESADFSLTIA